MSNSNTLTVPSLKTLSDMVKDQRPHLKRTTANTSRKMSDNFSGNNYVKSHGTITFTDNKSNRADFVRITPDTPLNLVKDLLYNDWCKERPSLVISITGGAADFKMKSQLLRVFRRGLLKVARTTGAWIITGGTNKGIMKMVGDLVQVDRNPSHPIPLIGIATWGCISDRAKLDVHGSNVHYSKPKSELKNSASLDPNHSAFILVDDGTENQFGGEIQFRAQLEKNILGDFFTLSHSPLADDEPPKSAKDQTHRSRLLEPVPVVLLVVEGGPNTVKTVYEAVYENNIPAVFLDGTGRCCDLFGKACRLYNKYLEEFKLNEQPSRLDPQTKAARFDDLKNKLRYELKDQLLAAGVVTKAPSTTSAAENENGNGTKVVDDPFDMIYQCVHTRSNLLNVVWLHSESTIEPDIDLAILHALLNATSDSNSGEVNYNRKCKQFMLALEWNRDDIVRRYIMKTDQDWKNVDLRRVFELALLQDKIGFVELLLDHDFSLTDAFQGNKLPSLYREMCTGKDTFCPNSMETIYSTILQPLIGDIFDVEIATRRKEATSESLENETIDEESCVCCITSDTIQQARREVSAVHGKCSADGEHLPAEHHMDVDKELFLWSVVTGKRDFARLFWSRSKNKICAALVALVMCKNLAHGSNDNIFSQIAQDFEVLGLQTLDRYYHTNPRDCKIGIVRQIPAFGNVTWLQLAMVGDVKSFMAHQAVQQVLNEIWYGGIHEHMRLPKTILWTLLPCFAGFITYQDTLEEINEKPTFNDSLLSTSFPSEADVRASSRECINRETDNGAHTQLLLHRRDQDTLSHHSAIEGGNVKTSPIVRYVTNILRFIHAPYVKYFYNIYSNLLFLLLFSYVMMCDFFPLYPVDMSVCPLLSSSDNNHPSTTNDTSDHNQTVLHGFTIHEHASIAEWILLLWVFTLLCEEVRQFVTEEAQTLRNRFANHFKTFWNALDLVAITLFYLGFTLRFCPPTECFCAARIILSVDLSLWFIRSLDMFVALERLGPKLVMIGEMAKDFMFFLLMLSVFILSFGVSTSVLYGPTVLSWHIPRKVINAAYWQMFGELKALEAFEHNYTPNGYAAFILIFAYMLIVSILLVNLLIAIFSYKFDQLQNDTDRIWKFQQYFLVCEYLTRPTLPPPFIILSHLWRFVLFYLAELTKSPWLKAMYKQHSSRTTYKKILDEKLTHVIETAEDAEGDEVYDSFMKSSRRGYEHNYPQDANRIQSPQEVILSKVRSLEDQIQIITNQQNLLMEHLGCSVDSSKTECGDREQITNKDYLGPPCSLRDRNDDGEQQKEPATTASVIDDKQQSAVTNVNVSKAQTISPNEQS